MLEIDILLPNKEIKKAPFSLMNIDEIYDYMYIEGHLNIALDKQVVFSEDIAVIEFYWYIVKWYRQNNLNQNTPFVYSTVEYTEPILTFSIFDNEHWQIRSPWLEVAVPVIVSNYELETQIKKIMCLLTDNLEISSD